jgi:hypothetical protein
MRKRIRRASITILTGLVLSALGILTIHSRPIDFDDSVSLFNGKDLTGWEGDTKLWSVRDAMIVGKSPGINYNAFLATTKEYEDFELKLSFRLVGGVGNSGVQFRSVRLPNSPQVKGYQADIGEQFWGSLYDEARRDKTLVDARQTGGLEAAKQDGWNEYLIRCQGDHVVLMLNGVKTVDYHEPDASIPRSGIIALQIHAGGPMEIQFKDLRIRKLDK